MDSNLIILLGLTLLAGLAMPLGGLFARIEHFHSQWLEQEFRHTVIAFGGGSLMSAVALVLVPEGLAHTTQVLVPLLVMVGGVAFMLLDRYLAMKNTPASQLAAMMLDFIPESIALGAAVAVGSPSAYLLATLIMMQNIPEGFNAYRELMSVKVFKASAILMAFVVMSFLGPVAGLVGYVWLADMPSVVSAIMLIASGGIMYSIFQDIAPQVVLKRHWGPPMGAVLGFNLGLIGYMLI